MRGVRSQIREKRILRIALLAYETFDLICQNVGNVITRLVAITDLIAVLCQLVTQIRLFGEDLRYSGNRIELVPAGRRRLPSRLILSKTASLVFPEQPRTVPCIIENRCYREGVIKVVMSSPRRCIVKYAGIFRVHSREQRRTRRPGDSGRNITVSEGRSVGIEKLSERRHHRKRILGLVIRVNQNDVRTQSLRRRSSANVSGGIRGTGNKLIRSIHRRTICIQSPVTCAVGDHCPDDTSSNLDNLDPRTCFGRSSNTVLQPQPWIVTRPVVQSRNDRNSRRLRIDPYAELAAGRATLTVICRRRVKVCSVIQRG